MKSSSIKKEKRTRRHVRIRAKISGTSVLPRLSVFKSNKHISVQVIDDENAVTVAAAHSRNVTGKTMAEKAAAVGKLIAEKAVAKKVSAVVFDRGGFMYTGNIKMLAEAARKGGLKF